MTLTRDSALQYVAIGLAVVGFTIVVESLLVETVNAWGVTLDISLAEYGVIAAALVLLSVETLFGGGDWLYPPLFLVVIGDIITTAVGPTDSNPLETVGFGVVLVGAGALFYLAWKRWDRPAADA